MARQHRVPLLAAEASGHWVEIVDFRLLVHGCPVVQVVVRGLIDRFGLPAVDAVGLDARGVALAGVYGARVYMTDRRLAVGVDLFVEDRCVVDELPFAVQQHLLRANVQCLRQRLLPVVVIVGRG